MAEIVKEETERLEKACERARGKFPKPPKVRSVSNKEEVQENVIKIWHDELKEHERPKDLYAARLGIKR